MFIPNCQFLRILTTDGWRLAIRNRNGLTGATNTAIVPDGLITLKQVKAFRSGEMVQSAFPTLNSCEREFILSGMTQADQDNFYGRHSEVDCMRFEVHASTDVF